jgi:hypothetical protein
MSTRQRWLLGAALLATLLAVWWAPSEPQNDVVLSARVNKAAELGPNLPSIALSVPTIALVSAAVNSASKVHVLAIRPREQIEGEAPDAPLFAATQWAPTLVVPPATPPIQQEVVELTPPPPPPPPPMPFRYLGRYQDAVQKVVFLQQNDQNLVVRVGDVLDGKYKVDSINATTLSLTYLPLNQPQSLDISGGGP